MCATCCSAVSPLDVPTTLTAASHAHLCAPSLLQVGAASRRDFSSFPPSVVILSGQSQTATTVDKLVQLVSNKRTQQPRVQTNPELTRFPKCVFHGNGSPEVFLRTVKVWSWRGRTQQGDASNGERLKSTHLNPTSSTRYLCLFVVV